MKRFFLTVVSVVVSVSAFAGGIVTNYNQSAAYIRMLARDAVIGVDGVFYNPAGLVYMPEGFYAQLNGQFINQTWSANSAHPSLPSNQKEQFGDVMVPFMPSLYLAYNTGDWSFSGGFNVIGGGGSAEFKNGTVETHELLSMITPALLPNAEYVSSNSYAKGSSAYYGIQLGASYKINDMFSVFLGGRYVIIDNESEAYIKNVVVRNTILGTEYEIPGGGEAIIKSNESGSGITPIIGADVRLLDGDLNFGLKYEFRNAAKTKTNSSNEGTLFPASKIENYEQSSEMPALLSIGVQYSVVDEFRINAGFHYYWDKSADYGLNDSLDVTTPIYAFGDNEDYFNNNSYEVALGLEYDFTEKVTASIGYLYASTGPKPEYQSSSSHYSLSSSTVGGGVSYKINDKFLLDFGVLGTFYQNETYERTIESATPKINYNHEYDKSTWIASIGVTYSLGN